jgi:hypothetical protein
LVGGAEGGVLLGLFESVEDAAASSVAEEDVEREVLECDVVKGDCVPRAVGSNLMALPSSQHSVLPTPQHHPVLFAAVPHGVIFISPPRDIS